VPVTLVVCNPIILMGTRLPIGAVVERIAYTTTEVGSLTFREFGGGSDTHLTGALSAMEGCHAGAKGVLLPGDFCRRKAPYMARDAAAGIEDGAGHSRGAISPPG
jgi:hypothetical protein